MQGEEGTAENDLYDGITDSVDMNLSKLGMLVMNRKLAAVRQVANNQTRLSH